jgi:hypothetical protein
MAEIWTAVALSVTEFINIENGSLFDPRLSLASTLTGYRLNSLPRLV